MVTIARLETWKPEDLSTIADQLNTHRVKLVDLDDEIDDGKPPTSWVGADSFFAEERHGELTNEIVDDVAEIHSVITALDTAATDLGKAKGDLESALERARTNGFTVDRTTGTVTDPETYPNRFLAEEAGAVVSSVAGDISTALTDAADADKALAAALRKANRGTIDVDGDLSDLGLTDQLRSMTREEQVDYLLEHPERGQEILDILPPGVKKELGERIADLADDVIEDGQPDDSRWYNKVRPGDYDDIDALDELVDAYGEDPEISTAFLNDLGPEGLVTLSAALVNLRPTSEDFAYDETDRDADDWDDLLGDTQTHLGELLAAGTGGDGPGGTPSRVDNEWIEGLDEAGRKEYYINYDHLKLGGMDRAYGYQVLAPLLSEGEQSSHLLNTVGEGMYEFEREHVREHGHLPWLAHYDGTEFDDRPSYTDMGQTRLDFTDGSGTDVPSGLDPMEGLFEGLARNPDAAREFFSPHDHDPANGLERVDYFVTDRDWPEVVTRDPDSGEESTFPSGARNLGDALRAATTDEPTDPTSREQVRDILEETVRTIANDEAVQGRDDAGDDQTAPFSEADWIHPDLRDDLADILGHHSETLHRTFELDSGEPVGPYDVGWDSKDLTRVLADLGKDPSAYETLRQASYVEAIHQMKIGMDGYDDLGVVAENDSRAVAKVLGSLDYGAIRSDMQESIDADAGHNSDVGSKADLARKLVGLVPTGSNPVVGLLADSGFDAVISGWEQANQVDHIGIRNYDAGELLAARRDMSEELVREVIRLYSNDEQLITNAANDAGDAYAGEYTWAETIVESEQR